VRGQLFYFYLKYHPWIEVNMVFLVKSLLYELFDGQFFTNWFLAGKNCIGQQGKITDDNIC
jgi:hypothetical protein